MNIYYRLFSVKYILTSQFSTVSDQQPAETVKGSAEKKEFQAETRMLLDIVARSLYSDKEVSVLISEKFLYNKSCFEKMY